MEKKRVLVSYEKLTPELKSKLKNEYPDGYYDFLKRIDAPKPFYGLHLSTNETDYLIKFDVERFMDDDDELISEDEFNEEVETIDEYDD